MIRLRRHPLIVRLALVCLALAAAPAHAAGESKATVDKVLAFYHTEEALNDALTHVEEALARRKKEVTIPNEHMDRILSLARRIYRKKNLFDVFKVAYSKNTTLENMEALHKWQLTVRGIKLRQGYAKLYEETPKAWQAYFDKESPKSLKPNRKNALTTYITSSELYEIQVGKVLGGDLAVQMALNALAPKGSRDATKIIKERVKGRRSGLIEAAREQYLVMGFYMLREMKNEDIDELTRFSTTVTGQAATKSYLKALELTFDSAASTLATEIIKGTK